MTPKEKADLLHLKYGKGKALDYCAVAISLLTDQMPGKITIPDYFSLVKDIVEKQIWWIEVVEEIEKKLT